MFDFRYFCNMDKLIHKVFEIIKDYRNDEGYQISESDIKQWAEQFDDEAEFMLQELSYLLPKVYYSKQRVFAEIRNMLNELFKFFKYDSVDSFFSDVDFLCLQPEGKSQHILVDMIDQIAYEKTGQHLSFYKSCSKIIFVYVDDVLATGGTIGKDIITWLRSDNNLQDLLNKKIKLVISLLCVHTWGRSFQDYRIRSTFPDLKNDTIIWGWSYEIQNHLKWDNQSLNIAIPIKDQPEDIKNYLSTLSATKYEDYAYREVNTPKRETFFSSPENRIRYENNLLQKGLEIIRRINEPGSNLRPLGMINPNYKTFGLGTPFFTWRNVPNNSPLVFWWDIPEHGWKPLFKPKRS